jgi:hypothetical protein
MRSIRRFLAAWHARSRVYLTTVTTGGVITVAPYPTRRAAAERAARPDVLSFRIESLSELADAAPCRCGYNALYPNPECGRHG